jgi:hypothetical protein
VVPVIPASTVTEQDPGAAAGNPASVVTTPAAGEKPTTDTQAAPVLTSAEVEAKIATALSEFQRGLQSTLDKRESRFGARLAELKNQAALVAEIGKAIGLDESKVGAMQAGMMSRAVDAAIEEEEAVTSDEGEDIDPDAVNAAGQALWERYGLQDNDPETATIVVNGTADDYLESIRLAGLVKQLRVKGVIPTTQAAAPASPGAAGPVNVARVPGVVSSGTQAPVNPLKNINSPGELYKIAAEQERQRRLRRR